ncbi:MAG: outer membrane protein assembly factor BamD [Fidelibacterota bacterium]
MQKQIFLLAAAGCLLWYSCAGTRVDEEVDDLAARFDRGMELYNKEKYYRAREIFEDVLIRGRHTDLGDDAQFYLAQSYFYNKEYLMAINEYDRLVRQMGYSPYVEESRFRICESYARLSPKYYHDQAYTLKAIEKFQEFIEDYPRSQYRKQSVESIRILRDKMARKLYESAVLYVKMEEYDSAVLYLEQLLESYYDTGFADRARLKMVETHILAGHPDRAEAFLDSNESKFKDDTILKEARQIIGSVKTNPGRKNES